MRTFINAWLRRWAEASLRTELHQAQERLISQQEKTARAVAQAEKIQKDGAKKHLLTKQRHAAANAYDSRLIKALRERMSPELFIAVTEHVRAAQKRDIDK